MVAEQLLTGSRWEILQELAKKPQSTSELATTLGTSQANISQQLRQLELAGYIQRNRATKHGKHYSYTITGTHLHITHLAERTAQKLSFEKQDINTFLAATLLHKNAIPLLTFILARPELTKRFLAIGILNRKEPELFILAEHVEDIRREHANIQQETINGNKRIVVWSHTPEEVREGIARKDHYYDIALQEINVMYDPQGELLALKTLLEERP